MLGGPLDAPLSFTEINAVQIQLENLVLAVGEVYFLWRSELFLFYGLAFCPRTRTYFLASCWVMVLPPSSKEPD